MPSEDMALASNPAHKEETTDTPPNSQELAVSQEPVVSQELIAPPELATPAELLSLPLEKLKEIAKHHKITGLSKIKLGKLVAKLDGLVMKEELA